MQDYHKLLVWQKAHALAVGIHRLTREWPRQDNAGLIGQIRRAALSIPANIAEGCGRATDRDFAKFLQVAVGSTFEVEYQIEFANEIGIVGDAEVRVQRAAVIEIRRMLVGLSKRVRREVPVSAEDQ